MHDLVVRGGLVADGSGGPGVAADVAVSGDRIAAIGPGLRGAVEVDASGCVVAPGFVDIHTHYDAQVFWDPALTPSCFHGVTTVVAGNCGFSIAPTRPEHRSLIARTLENVEDMDVAALEAGVPWDFETFPEYLQSVERRGTVLNFAAYVGHTALRLFVLGDAGYHRAATPEERAAMQAVLGEALDAGAAGLATSLLENHRGADGLPVPSRSADRDELLALLDVMAGRRLGVFSIAPGGWCSLADVYELQRSVGVPFTYGALLTKPDGSHRARVELNDAGWEQGAQVWPQVSPRALTFAFSMAQPFTLNPNPVFAALLAGDLTARSQAYADEAWRRRAWQAWEDGTVAMPRWDTYTVGESEAHPEHVGRTVAAVAAERGVGVFDTLLDLALAEKDLALRVACVVANDDDDEVAYLLTREHCTIGLSDAGAHVGQICDAAQATDFLGRWVRDRGVMPVEQAVRRLSGLQADIFGFADRGYLRPGYAADVVVFDPAAVDPGPVTRVRDFPADTERLTAAHPSGIRTVLVNGRTVIADGVLEPSAVDDRPGRIVRPATREAGTAR